MRYFLSFFLVLCFPLMGANHDSKTIRISGFEEIPLSATIATTRIGIEETAASPNIAQERLAERQKHLFEAFKNDLRVSQLESKHPFLQTIYDQKDRNRITGYKAQIEISWKSSVTDAGHLLALALNHGADQIRQVSVEAEEEALFQARKKAVRNASKNALKEGKEILEALNLDYERIERIEVIPSRNFPIVRGFAMETMKKSSFSPVEITEQEIQISAEVVLILRFL